MSMPKIIPASDPVINLYENKKERPDREPEIQTF